MHYPDLAFVFVYFFYDFSFLALSACKLGQWEVTLQSTTRRSWLLVLHDVMCHKLFVCRVWCWELLPSFELCSLTFSRFPIFRLPYLFIYLLPTLRIPDNFPRLPTSGRHLKCFGRVALIWAMRPQTPFLVYDPRKVCQNFSSWSRFQILPLPICGTST